MSVATRPPIEQVPSPADHLGRAESVRARPASGTPVTARPAGPSAVSTTVPNDPAPTRPTPRSAAVSNKRHDLTAQVEQTDQRIRARRHRRQHRLRDDLSHRLRGDGVPVGPDRHEERPHGQSLP